jgi:TP901 family phage tail tape measure protein
MAIFIPLVTKFDSKGLQGAQRALANFQNFAVDVGRIAAAAVAAVGVASVREAAKFETTFAKIEGLVGLTRDEIAELEEAARRLGPQFGASANEAGEALFFITSAGLRGSAAVNVLEASLKGAAIGLGDAKTIADLATSAVNAYGESNLDGAQAVDVLAEAVRLGKLEPAELAASLGDVLPLASVLGVRFDEVGAAMAGMSKTGTDAATASTQLRGIFNTLVKPTAEAERALADMGLSAEGLREQIKEKGLFNTLETLTDAFDGNIEATATVFGNVRALTGVLDLMGPSIDDNRELFALMADDIGVLDEAFDIDALVSSMDEAIIRRQQPRRRRRRRRQRTAWYSRIISTDRLRKQRYNASLIEPEIRAQDSTPRYEAFSISGIICLTMLL